MHRARDWWSITGEESIMKAVIVATLLSLFLSSPAIASVTDSAQQMRSSSKAASGYISFNIYFDYILTRM